MRSVILYAIFPASREGNIKTEALPLSGEFLAFLAAIDGTIAESI